MPTFAELEASVEDSEAREYFLISVNGITNYRHASGSRDLSVDGVIYTAIAIDRGEQVIQMPGNSESNMVITLPITHAIVKRWLASGTPPKQVSVQVWRRQAAADESEQVWAGNVTSLSCEKSVAKLHVPSRAGGWMLRTVAPSIGAGCPHILYSARCGVDREGTGPSALAHKVVTTIASIQGREIKVSLLSTERNGSWAQDGEVYHPASGERMTVLRQADTSPGSSSSAWLTMQAPIYGAKVGDTVHVFAGCDHSLGNIGGCFTRFDNRQNFGGAAFLPTKNIFIPGSYGIRTVT